MRQFDLSGQTGTSSYDDDAAESGVITDDQSTWMQTSIEGEGTLTFWWRVSSQSNKDWLEFWLDGVRQDRISGNVSWQQKSYPLTGAGPHTLQWRYVKDGSKTGGSDCGWVDYVQWSGSYPDTGWDTITYTYDAAGRRVEKAVDGQTTTKYIYDGDHCLAEYDGAGSLLRKYIYGPGVDQPICMIESAGGAASYYHFDGLGSCIALTGSAGNAVQLYEYSAYGQVAASDPNHPNRFLFTGREFDADTGLYYYRARYYNPEVGRFLQTDPAREGMNRYAYCGNAPLSYGDPSGCRAFDPVISPYKPFTTFEFTFPALAIGPDIASDDHAQSAAGLFFSADGWMSWPAQWSVESAHLEGNGRDIHVRFICYYDEGSAAPPAPALDVKYMKQRGSALRLYGPMNEAVITIKCADSANEIGLLTQWKLDRILFRSKLRVRLWPVRPGGPHVSVSTTEMALLLGWCDTPFSDFFEPPSPIDKFEFGKVIYDNGEINYYLEGYAMRHFGLWYKTAQTLVILWKSRWAGRLLSPDDPALEGTFYWFNKGWDERGYFPWEGLP